MGNQKKGYFGVDPDLTEELLDKDGKATGNNDSKHRLTSGGFSWGSGKPASPPPLDRNRIFSEAQRKPTNTTPSDHEKDEDFEYKKMDP